MAVGGALLLLSAAAGAEETKGAAAPRLALSDCGPALPGGRCGTYEVFENRGTKSGRKIGLRVVVLPATGADRQPDPLFFFAGGPGDAASRIAGGAAQMFAEILKHRDMVFVDQRGTGASHGLQCTFYDAADPQSALGDFFPPGAVKRCRAELEKDTDLTQYTTSLAMADIDDVREALGYERINLWGGSYGTRAALVYLREHGAHVRSATLMGVLPTSESVPSHFARSAQRALDGVVADCAAEPGCHAAFPALRSEIATVFERLAKGPAPAQVLDPESGEARAVQLSGDLLAEALRYLMYESGSAGLIPALIHNAAQGELGPFAEFALFNRKQIVTGLGSGLYLSVTCAEDLPWIKAEQAEREAKGTFLGDYRYAQQQRACALWPQAKVPASFLAPVESKVPALLFSGQWDPTTPPALGDEAARSLPNSRHVVVPHGGHSYDGLEGLDCVDHLMTAFIERGSSQGLDVTCVAAIKRRPFPTTLPSTRVVSLPDADVARLAGRYVADGAPIEATLTAQGSRIRVEMPGGPRLLLAPVSPTRFRVVGALGMYAVFEMADQKVTRLVVEENGQPTLALKPAPAP
jgi:pimeloyl-ACP methyl ester carboxylesterase